MESGCKRAAISIIMTALLLLLFYSYTFAQERVESCEQSCTDHASSQETASGPLLYRETQCISLNGFQYQGITVAMDNRICAAGGHALLILDRDGAPLKKIVLESEATCIASDSVTDIYIGLTDHVEVYSAEGVRKDIWASLGSNAIITSIAVAPDMVYVADAGNRLVMGFSKSGRLEAIIGNKSAGADRFIIPSPYFDIAVGPDNSLWIANTGRRQLEKYTPDGTMISAWGESSTRVEGFAGCCNPSHFAILPDGSFVTSEKGIPRVKLYDPNGEFVELVAGPDRFMEGATGLDIAVNGRGEILILDPGKECIRVFKQR